MAGRRKGRASRHGRDDDAMMKRNSLRTTCRVRRHGSDPSQCLPPEDGFSSRILPGCTIERIKRELPNQDRPSASTGQRHAVRRKAFRVPERPSLQAADDVEGAVVFEARTIGVMHRSRESDPDSCVSMITVYAARCARPEAFAPKRVVRLPRRGATTHRSEASAATAPGIREPVSRCHPVVSLGRAKGVYGTFQ